MVERDLLGISRRICHFYRLEISKGFGSFVLEMGTKTKYVILIVNHRYHNSQPLNKEALSKTWLYLCPKQMFQRAFLHRRIRNQSLCTIAGSLYFPLLVSAPLDSPHCSYFHIIFISSTFYIASRHFSCTRRYKDE